MQPSKKHADPQARARHAYGGERRSLSRKYTSTVMPGSIPGIHVLMNLTVKDVDGIESQACPTFAAFNEKQQVG
jgi:hypothetical protein